jgi:hypothetical protein
MQTKTFMPYVPSVADFDPELVHARRFKPQKGTKSTNAD